MVIGNKLVFPGPMAAGLTKRELFAAMAMQGLLSNSALVSGGMFNVGNFRTAVESADALLAELAKEPTNG